MTKPLYTKIGRRMSIEPDGWAWIMTGERPTNLAPAADQGWWRWYMWKDTSGHNIGNAEEVWRIYGDAIVADYARHYPGERPFAWWYFTPARGDESAADYLDRTSQWLPGERAAYRRVNRRRA